MNTKKMKIFTISFSRGIMNSMKRTAKEKKESKQRGNAYRAGYNKAHYKVYSVLVPAEYEPIFNDLAQLAGVSVPVWIRQQAYKTAGIGQPQLLTEPTEPEQMRLDL